MVAPLQRTTASGSTDTFSVSFPYIDKTHVKVRLDGVLQSASDIEWPSNGSIRILAGNPAAGVVVERRRETPAEAIVTFSAGNLDTDDLNTADTQALYVAEEASVRASDSLLSASAVLTSIQTLWFGSHASDVAATAYGVTNSLTKQPGLTQYLNTTTGRKMTWDGTTWITPDDFITVESLTYPSYAAAGLPAVQQLMRAPARLLVGDVNDYGGQEFFEDGPKGWLETAVPSTLSIATLAAVSPVGYGAVLGATRTSDNPLEQSEGSWALGGFAFVNKAGSFTAYGALIEARRYGNAGFAHGVEIDAISLDGTDWGTGAVTTPKISPNSLFAAAHLTGAWLSIARPLEGGDITAALAIVNNSGSRFETAGRAKTGIVIDQKAILGQDGSYAGVTEGDAIAVGKRHRIGWVSDASANELAAFITSSTTVATGAVLEFQNGGAVMRSTLSNAWSLKIEVDDDAEGHIAIRPADATHHARLFVEASGAYKNLELAADGGVVDLAGTLGTTAFRAYSTTGHGTFIAVNANAAGFAPWVQPEGAAADIPIAIKAKGTGDIILDTTKTAATGLPSKAIYIDGSGFVKAAP